MRALLIILTVFTSSVFAQSGKGYFDRFGLSEGLSQATVNCLFQDSYGFLWIGTEDGLNRFDGYVFEVYQHNPSDPNSISNNVIYSIYEDSDGIVWIGTASGLNRFDRFSNRFEIFRYRSDDSKSISDNTITAIAPAGENHLWIGTRNGLNLMAKEERTFHSFKNSGREDDFSLSSNLVNDLCLDKQGRLWCATNSGLNLFDDTDSTFLNFQHQFGDDQTIVSPIVNCLDVDQWGNVWVGTEAGISLMTPALEVRQILEPRIPEYGGFSEPVRSMLITRDHVVWIGTDSELLCLDDQGMILRHYEERKTEVQSLYGGAVHELLEDRSGAVWIGTFSGGLFRFTIQQQIFEHYTRRKDDGRRLRSEVWNVFERSDGQLLVGGTDGLFGLNTTDEVIEPFDFRRRKNAPVLMSPVRGIVEHDGNFYFGLMGQGLFVFDSQWKLLNHIAAGNDDKNSLGSNRVTCMLKDSEGIWIGTQGAGLHFVEYATHSVSQWNWKSSREEGLLDNHVTALAKDKKGDIWIGTANRGLSRLHRAEKRFTHYEQHSEKKESLSSNQITSLLVDSDSRLWIATRGGGLNLHLPGDTVFKKFRTNDGLPANTVSALVEDSTGIIWASTGSGLVRIDLEQKDFRKFNEADGLRQLEFMPGSAGRLKSGDLWFGSSVGVVCLKSESYKPNNYSPPPVFTRVSVTKTENGVQSEESLFPDPDQPLEFSYGVNTIHVEFALLNLIQADKNTYMYLVNGLFEDWVNLGYQRRITLANLEPGSYTIKVKGTNYDGIRNPKYTELNLIIRPAFWQTGWFKFLILIGLIVTVYLLYRWRIDQVKAQNKMLEAIVAERTHEIAKERDEKAILLKEIHHRVKNNLQIISSLLSLQSRMANDPKVENLFLESTNRVQTMSMIHEKMYRSENLKEINVAQYIRELVDALLDAYSVGATIESSVDVKVQHQFAVDTLTPLGLIINELVSNSLKYAFKGRTNGRVTLQMDTGNDDEFNLYITDDGVGFTEADKREGGFGTELVEDLAAQLQGHIHRIDSKQGTAYHLVFKNIDDH